MIQLVALAAQGDSVGYFIPEFRVVGKRLDVVCVTAPAVNFLFACLTCVPISFPYCVRPFFLKQPCLSAGSVGLRFSLVA